MTKCKRLSNKCAAWGIAIAHFESFNLEQIKSASKPLENDKFTFKFNLGAVSHSSRVLKIQILDSTHACNVALEFKIKLHWMQEKQQRANLTVESKNLSGLPRIDNVY